MSQTPDTRSSLIYQLQNLQNHSAWEEFSAIYMPLIARTVRRYGVSPEMADEVTQEILCRIATSIEKYDHSALDSSFRGWLYYVARNLTLDFLRNRQKHTALYKTNNEFDFNQVKAPSKEESSDFMTDYKRQLLSWATEKARPSFKKKNWQAFWLSSVKGQDIKEVARQLAMDVGQVYVARSRITARIRTLVQQKLDQVDDSIGSVVQSGT